MNINHLLATASTTEVTALYLFSVSFLAGILVSFTPCIYPMIPITAGILRMQASLSVMRSFATSLAYIVGMALVYASLGYVSAKSSMVFGRWLSSPWLVGVVIVVFLYIAGSMFGWYSLRFPTFLQRTSTTSVHGSLASSFMYGLVSGTVASPCLTPALAILLGLVAKQGKPVIGFLSLLFFALGMGILLLLIGTFSASMNLLPRAGDWMMYVERAFGFLMLVTCIYFAGPFFPEGLITVGLFSVASFAALYYFLHARKSWVAFSFGIVWLLVGTWLVFASI